MNELVVTAARPPENSGLQSPSSKGFILPFQGQVLDEQLGRLCVDYPDRGEPYAEKIRSLFDEIPGAEWLFPNGLGHIATGAARQLVIGTVETLRTHLAGHEQTAGNLKLRSGWELPYDFTGTDPLKRLEHLRLAYWMAGQVESNPDIAAVQVMHGAGFAKWRFVDTSGRLPSCAVLHVRPLGSEQYDPKFEYGKPGYGAEATEAFTVDTGVLQAWFRGGMQPGLPDIAKQRGPNTQISIRSDREAGNSTDPHRRADEPIGQRVQDVGSILNRRGRIDPGTLLAAGNPETLNHTPVFPAAEGQAEVFAGRARDLIARVTEHSASLADLRNMQYRFRRAGRKSSHGFAAFKVGDNPYDIPGVRLLAHAAGVGLGTEPNEAEIQQLFDAFGKEAVFRTNVDRFAEVTDGLSQAALARLIERTGALSSIPLRTVYGEQQVRAVSNGMIFGGTAGWTDARTSKLIDLHRGGVRIGQVILAASGRNLDSPTELAQPDVVALQQKLVLKRIPTENDYMRRIVAPRLASAGLKVGDIVDLPFDVAMPDSTRRRQTAQDLARAVAAVHPEIANGPILQVLNQPAGHVAADVLSAFNETLPGFSAEQFYIASSGNRIARTPDELRLGLYQNTYTAPSSVVRWVHALHRLNTLFA